MKTITVLGGGTGTFVVLTGIKNLPIDLGVIVTMMDSGGSTGRLRDQLGVLPRRFAPVLSCPFRCTGIMA